MFLKKAPVGVGNAASFQNAAFRPYRRRRFAGAEGWKRGRSDAGTPPKKKRTRPESEHVLFCFLLYSI